MPPHDTIPPAGSRLEDIDQQWDAWRPDQVAQRLRAVTAPWYVAGGWALDLHRGEQTRAHHDLEIGVPGAAFWQIRGALAGCEFEAVGAGQLWPADSAALAQTHQTWVSEPDPQRVGGRVYRLDVFREPEQAGQWVCRRDEQIVLPYERVIGRDGAGIPYLMPEIALLFKAKQPRQKDDADFAMTLPVLTQDARAWLGQMLDRLYPGHAWIGAL